MEVVEARKVVLFANTLKNTENETIQFTRKHYSWSNRGHRNPEWPTAVVFYCHIFT